MPDKKYLNEENYQKTKRTLVRIGIAIIIIGVAIGLALITIGVIKNINIEQSATTKIAESESEKEQLQLRLEELETSLDELITQEKARLETLLVELKAQKAELEKQQRAVYNAERLSERYYELAAEISAIREEISDIELILWKIEVEWSDLTLSDEHSSIIEEISDINSRIEEIDKYLSRADFDKDFDKTSSSARLFSSASSIIWGSCTIGGMLIFIASRRKITAFNVQSTMPVAKEAMDEMASPIGNIFGEVAKTIRRDKFNCPHCGAPLEGESSICEHCGRRVQ